MTRADAVVGNTCAKPRGIGARTGGPRPLRRASGRVSAFVTVALVAASPAALGYDSERARAYFARELAECSAWYTLVAEAPGLDEITRIRFRAVATSLVSTAADIATEPWAVTQTDFAAKNIRREMGYSWKNYAVVDKEYGQRCRDIVTDPVARRRYWVDRYK